MKTERFLLLSSLVLIACISSSSGQTKSQPSSATPQWNVLGEEVDGVPVDQLLKNYLLQQLRPHFATRRVAIKEITTPQQYEARRQEISDTLHRINGPFPEKTPLNARVVGRIERADYIIEKVIYESRPSHYVTANLYLPKGSDEPVPGVLIPCGHSANGKAEEAYQSIAFLWHGMEWQSSFTIRSARENGIKCSTKTVNPPLRARPNIR